MQKTDKKEWTTPRLIVHGDLTELTRHLWGGGPMDNIYGLTIS
jgi:hypothetical protein